jgi:hypothetical protein
LHRKRGAGYQEEIDGPGKHPIISKGKLGRVDCVTLLLLFFFNNLNFCVRAMPSGNGGSDSRFRDNI